MLRDADRRTCDKIGHLSNVRKSAGKGGKSKGTGKDENFPQRIYHGESSERACLRCGRKGHVKSNCRFKDEKC